MSSDSDTFHALELGKITDEFLRQLREGEKPAIEDYVQRYPAFAAQLGDILPVLAKMEFAGEDCVTDSEKRDSVPPKKLGEFRILREIGRGGMGIVYEAEQESLGRRVALKTLRIQSLLDPKHLERFQREARAVAQLHHSNIVPVHSVGHCNGTDFYTMQFIHGLGLDEVLDEIRRTRSYTFEHCPIEHCPIERCPIEDSDSDHFPSSNELDGKETNESSSSVVLTLESGISHSDHKYAKNVARIGRQVAEALEYAHSQGIQHRDVKPSNLLLDIGGNVWLTDFGLAKLNEDDLTMTGDLVGTLRYMPPERLRGWSDPRSDVYSLGLTLYEMLALRPAFPGTDRAEIVRRITMDRPTRLRRIDNRIPRDLETVVLKSIEKEPHLRYQTALDFADDLRRFCNRQPIVARRTPWRERFYLWSRRNPMAAGLSLLVALLLLLLTILSTLSAIWLKNELDRAVSAESTARSMKELADDKLFESLLGQSQDGQAFTTPGQRRKKLDSIAQAAALGDRLDLDEERRCDLRVSAITCVAQMDLELSHRWDADDYGYRSSHVRWAIDADARRYACEREDGDISVREMATNRELNRLPGVGPRHAGLLRPFLKFSPDGKYIGVYAALDDGSIIVDLLSIDHQESVFGQPVPSSGWDYSRSIGFTADSSEFAYFDPNQKLCLYSIKDGSLRRLQTNERSLFMEFSPDGNYVAIEEQGHHVVILDVKSGEPVKRIPQFANISSFAWSGDNKFFAIGGDNGVAYVWSLDDTRTPVCECQGHSNIVCDITFSKDWLLATTSWDQTTRIWSVPHGEELLRIKAFGGLRFSDSADKFCMVWPGHEIRQYEIAGQDECRVIRHRGSGTAQKTKSVSFSPSGQYLAIAGGTGGLSVYATHSSTLSGDLLEKGTDVKGVCFSPAENEILVATSKEIRKIELRPDFADRVAVGQSKTIFTGTPTLEIAMSKDFCTAFITSRGAGHGAIWDAIDRRTRFTVNDRGWMNNASISPDGRWSACGSWHDGHWSVWDNVNGQRVKQVELDRSGAGTRFSPDGKWLLIFQPDQIVFHEVGNSWEESFRLPREDLGLGNAAFTEDMRYLAVSEMYHVNLYEFPSLKLVARLRGPRGLQLSGANPSAAAMQFSPDGHFLAVGTFHNTTLVWNLKLVRKHLAGWSLDW